jgi:hypothetical protein
MDGFERHEFFAGAGQHFALHVEFLTGHQIQFGEQAGQRGTHVLLDLAGGRRGQQGRDAGGHFIEQFRIQHGVWVFGDDGKV